MNDFLEVHYIIRIVRRWWWIPVVTTLLAVLAGYAFSVRQTETFRAISSLMVGPTIQAANFERYDLEISQELARTYADIAHRQPILQATVEALTLDQPWQSLVDQVRVTPVDETQLLEIRVDASSPEQAAAIADEVARQLILLSPTTLDSRQEDDTDEFVRRRLERLRENIEGGQARLDALENQISDFLLTPLDELQVAALQTKVETLEALVARWESTYASLYSSLRGKSSTNYLTVIEPAQVLPAPVRPRIKLNLLLSAVIGSMLGLGLVFLLAYADKRLRAADEVSEMLRLPSLGEISRVPAAHAEDMLVTHQGVFSSIAEDCRMLRSKLLFLSKEWPRKIFLVTSPAPAEGKSLVVANLGIAMANIGLKTVIIDANLRNPVQHIYFRLPQLDGLTEEIHSSRSDGLLPRRVKKSQIENLYVLTSGSLSLASPDRLATEQMTEMLAILSEQYDIVLCDAPEAVTFADTLMLANQAQGVLLVIDAGNTHRAAALQAVDNLRQASAELMGFVLNRASVEARTASLTYRRSPVTVNTMPDEPAPAEM